MISIDFLVPPLIGSLFLGRLAVLGLEGPEGVGPPWETSLLLATKGGRTLGPHSYVSESCGAVETQAQEGTPTQPTSVAILLPRVFVSASTGPKTGLSRWGATVTGTEPRGASHSHRDSGDKIGGFRILGRTVGSTHPKTCGAGKSWCGIQ